MDPKDGETPTKPVKSQKKPEAKLVDQNAKQFIFDTSEVVGKTLQVSLNKSEPVSLPITDEITIWQVKVPDSYSLDYKAV